MSACGMSGVAKRSTTLAFRAVVAFEAWGVPRRTGAGGFSEELQGLRVALLRTWSAAVVKGTIDEATVVSAWRCAGGPVSARLEVVARVVSSTGPGPAAARSS